MSTHALRQSKIATTLTPASAAVRDGLLQRKCACGGTPGLTGECEECRKKRFQGRTQNAELGARNDSIIPSTVHEVLQSAGHPLENPVRQHVESLLGANFSHVRIHPDAPAATSAQLYGAAAYTYGSHIYFGPNRYRPETPSGESLLLHELTHTLQQPRHLELAPHAAVSSRLDASEVAARAMVAAAISGRPIPTPSPCPAHIALQSVGEETAEQPADVMSGALVTGILISKARHRVGFQTALGTIMGDVTTDLQPGTYRLQPETSKQRWNFVTPQVPPGIRFSVSLENANPWTLRYADPLTLVVQAGLAAEPKTAGDMVGPGGQMLDELWLSEGMPLRTPPSGPDDFESAVYDVSYRSENGALSMWLSVYYRDNTVKDIHLDSIKEDMPNLWAARQRAYEDMDNYNTEFLGLAFLGGVWPILTMGPSFTSVPEAVAPVGRPPIRSAGSPPARAVPKPEPLPGPPAAAAARPRPQLVPAPAQPVAAVRPSPASATRQPVTSGGVVGNTALKMEPEVVSPPATAPSAPQLRLVEPEPVAPPLVEPAPAVRRTVPIQEPAQAARRQKPPPVAIPVPPPYVPLPLPAPDPTSGRRQAGQTCDNNVLDHLQAEMHNVCGRIFGGSCSDSKVSPKKLARYQCSHILRGIQERRDCLMLRQRIQDLCFGGVADAAHIREMANVTNGLNECIALAAVNCAPGHPMAGL